MATTTKRHGPTVTAQYARYVCGFCGKPVDKHLKHCPVPKLTPTQIDWIAAACIRGMGGFPLR